VKRPHGIILTGDNDTIDCRGPGIHCWHWSDLLGEAERRFTDRPIDGVDGVDPGPRRPGGLRAGLRFRLWGQWNHDADTHLTDRALWRPNLLDMRDRLYALLAESVLGVDVVEDGGDYAGTVHVDDPDRPVIRGHYGTLVVAVTVAEGRLERAGS
jgi:hypothetical protein